MLHRRLFSNQKYYQKSNDQAIVSFSARLVRPDHVPVMRGDSIHLPKGHGVEYTEHVRALSSKFREETLGAVV